MAEGGDDGEIEADVEDGAAKRAATHLTLEVFQRGHEELGIIPAGGAGRGWCVPAGEGRLGRRLFGLGVGWRGLWFRQWLVALDVVDVAAGGGAGEQDALKRRGAEDAAVQVGEDGGDVGGAEAGGDGVEVGGGGALADGVDQVAAIAKQVTDAAEKGVDLFGQGGDGVLLRRIMLLIKGN